MGGVILPDAEWRRREGLDWLTAQLDAQRGMARFVGGAVRDTLMGIEVQDVDIATPFAPEEVIRRLKAAGIKAIPTGIDHGTVTAVIESGTVEVTTLRRDVSTDGRRATVAFTDDWREDAARRDFTINALYADPLTGEVFDYFGGLADLETRHIRFIGDAYQRIAEDHLRILRFFRFLARFGDVADPVALEACTARAKDLMALSRERIRDELLKLLVAKDAVRVVAMMLERGIFAPVVPEIADVAKLARLAAREVAAGIAASPLRRLAALLPGAAVDGVGARLKLSNAERKRLAVATQPLLTDAPRALAYRLGVAGAEDQLLLSDLPDAAVLERLAMYRDWVPPRLPLSGGALVARGLAKGPDVARALRLVEDRWIAEGFPDEARVEAIADEVAAQI